MGVLLFYWKRLYPELENKRENSLYYLQSLLFPPGGPLGAVCIRDMTSLTSSHKSRIFKIQKTHNLDCPVPSFLRSSAASSSQTFIKLNLFPFHRILCKMQTDKDKFDR